MSRSVFTLEDTWEDAVTKTSDGLVPLTIMLMRVPTIPPINLDYALGDKHYPYALVAMTVRFSEEEFNGKLGWIHLDSEIKDDLSQALYDMNKKDEWVFLSQVYEEETK